MAREVDAMSGLSEKLEDARRSVRDNVRGALEDTFREWCAAADIRIVVDGEESAELRPWDVMVHDRRLFGRVLSHGTLGLGVWSVGYQAVFRAGCMKRRFAF